MQQVLAVPHVPMEHGAWAFGHGRSIRAGNVRRQGTLPADKPVAISEVADWLLDVTLLLVHEGNMWDNHGQSKPYCLVGKSMHQRASTVGVYCRGVLIAVTLSKGLPDISSFGHGPLRVSGSISQVRFAQTSLKDACPFKVGWIAGCARCCASVEGCQVVSDQLGWTCCQKSFPYAEDPKSSQVDLAVQGMPRYAN